MHETADFHESGLNITYFLMALYWINMSTNSACPTAKNALLLSRPQ